MREPIIIRNCSKEEICKMLDATADSISILYKPLNREYPVQIVRYTTDYDWNWEPKPLVLLAKRCFQMLDILKNDLVKHLEKLFEIYQLKSIEVTSCAHPYFDDEETGEPVLNMFYKFNFHNQLGKGLIGVDRDKLERDLRKAMIYAETQLNITYTGEPEADSSGAFLSITLGIE